MTFLVNISGSVLQETLCRSLARHAYIKALQHTIELWVSHAESCVFCKDLLRKLNHVNPVPHDTINNIPGNNAISPFGTAPAASLLFKYFYKLETTSLKIKGLKFHVVLKVWLG